MRVGRFSAARLRDDEQGAVLAIVAISLLVLLGMLALTYDLGRGVAIKRNMVIAADAGALAAARECGLGNGEVAATNAADQLIAQNNASAARVGPLKIDQVPQCSGLASDGKRQVTVTVRVPQEYVFAPILGFSNGTVVASATAEWTLGETSPAPLRIDQLKLDQCLQVGVPDSEGRVDCWFTFEKGPAPLNSDWGWLNLPEGWPIQDQDTNPPQCDSQKGGAKDLSDYIGAMGGMGTPGATTLLPGLWDPTGAGNPPTWVCGATGHKASNVGDISAWVTNVKQLMTEGKLLSEPAVLFPIVACDPTKTPGNPECREWKYTPGVAYPVVKLQGFYVKEAFDGQDARRQPECDFTRQSSDVFCIHLQTTGADTPTAGGHVTVRLVD